MSDALLRIDDLDVRFGGVKALTGVELAVRRGTIHGLIGPNGAGKTTLLNVVSRIIQPVKGAVVFDGAELLGLAPHRLRGMGIARTFQNLGLVETATAIENVMCGLHADPGSGLFDDVRRLWNGSRERGVRDAAAAALDRVGLLALADSRVARLSYGDRKKVELARACVGAPRLLLLDEPTAGLGNPEIRHLQSVLVDLRRSLDLTILLITHHVEFLVGMADRISVLDLGVKIADGVPAEIRRDPRVVSAYLGG